MPALVVYRDAAVGNGRAPRARLGCVASGRHVARRGAARRPDGARFRAQVLASADAVGQRYRFDRRARPSRGEARHVPVRRAAREEHGLGDRERLLLKVAALLHDVGIYISLRAHHKHSQSILAESQIFGLSAEETAIVSNIARYHRRGTPQRTHVPYVALDRPDRLVVNKLAAILRIANALDAEHVQKVRSVRVMRRGSTWVLELEGSATSRWSGWPARRAADMLVETFGRQVLLQPAWCRVMTPKTAKDTPLFFNRELSWLAFNERVSRGSGRPADAALRAHQVRRDRRIESRRVLHGSRRRHCCRRCPTTTRRPIRPD